MKLDSVPNIRVEDFPDQKDWIGKLSVQINPFFLSVSQLFNQNLSFGDNISSQTKSYSQDFSGTFIPLTFLWTGTGTPIDLRIISASKTTVQTPTILLPAWSYNNSNKMITIGRLVEIVQSTDQATDTLAELSGQYQFTVRVTV